MTAPHEVHFGRIYDPLSVGDGARILVDRLWPRGRSKEAAAIDAWYRDIAPSTELRTWFGHAPARFDEFTSRYRAELAEPPRAALVDALRDLAQRGPVLLLTASKAVEISQAAVLAGVLNARSPS